MTDCCTIPNTKAEARSWAKEHNVLILSKSDASNKLIRAETDEMQAAAFARSKGRSVLPDLLRANASPALLAYLSAVTAYVAPITAEHFEAGALAAPYKWIGSGHRYLYYGVTIFDSRCTCEKVTPRRYFFALGLTDDDPDKHLGHFLIYACQTAIATFFVGD